MTCSCTDYLRIKDAVGKNFNFGNFFLLLRHVSSFYAVLHIEASL